MKSAANCSVRQQSVVHYSSQVEEERLARKGKRDREKDRASWDKELQKVESGRVMN